uniref:Uncharacterized protein n=1 Tax=Arundo donax TaxID=35708 RepID=A0A0A9DNM5_ARUDO
MAAGGPRIMPLMMGKQKAAVFPDPVCAHAMRSRPASEIGMACRCTGVGRTYLHRRMLSLSASPRSISAKVETGGGTSRPLVSTGMSSYASKLIPEFWCSSNGAGSAAAAASESAKGLGSRSHRPGRGLPEPKAEAAGRERRPGAARGGGAEEGRGAEEEERLRRWGGT